MFCPLAPVPTPNPGADCPDPPEPAPELLLPLPAFPELPLPLPEEELPAPDAEDPLPEVVPVPFPPFDELELLVLAQLVKKIVDASIIRKAKKCRARNIRPPQGGKLNASFWMSIRASSGCL